MGNPKTDSGEQKNPSKGSGSANSGSSSKKNPAKLPPAGFIYSDDENLMDELSMGWGLTASEEEDELDAVINKTVDMSKVSNTKLKALTEPPKGGLERIERVRAERASKDLPVQKAAPSVKEQDEREAAAKRAKQAAAEREEAARAAAQREKAERELAAREAAEREAALKARAEEEAREKKAKELRAREERERAEQEARETAEREARDRLAREQEEEEARERAALEARLLERAEKEARDREAKEAKEREEREARDREERAEELRIAAAAREKAEREAAEREEAEREIAERERLQKEAAAKLKAKQEQARKEAEEEAAREREEQELAEKERAEKERAEKELAGKEKLDKAAKSEKENAGPSKGGRVELPKKEIKAQRIGGPKTAEEKKPIVGTKSDSSDEDGKDANKPQPEVKSKKESPALEKVGTTSKLSRTPEEELAALLAEDEEEQIPKPPEEKTRKPIIPQDAKTSRSGLAAMEPTDDTPLTGMLKAIKPVDREKSSAKVASQKSDEPAQGDAVEAQDESSMSAEPTLSAAEVQSKDDSLTEGSDSADAGNMLASEIDNALCDEESGAMETAAKLANESSSEPEVPDFHLPAQPSEAARPGLAHAFEFGAHLPSAHGREADADPLLSHGNDPSFR